IREYVLRQPGGSAEYLIMLYRCVSELFLGEDYEITSWIAHHIMRELHVAELILYPSLMADEKDLCHAFHTDPIDAHRVVMHRVEEVDAKQRPFTSLNEGLPEGGVVRWKRSAGRSHGVRYDHYGNVSQAPRNDLA